MQYKGKGFQKNCGGNLSMAPSLEPDHTGYNAGYDVGANILCLFQFGQIFLESFGIKCHWEMHSKFFSDENMKVPRVRMEPGTLLEFLWKVIKS